MYADRHARRHVNPGSVVLALAINGGILGGLVLFANPTFTRHFDPPFKITNIPLDPVPPPPPPPPKPEPQHKAIEAPPRQTLDTSKLVTVLKIADPTPIASPTFTPTPIEGTADGGGVVLPIKPPPPVLTQPTIDPRYANLFQPILPPDEQRAGHDGRVVVRVLVGVDGRVKDIAQVTATSDSFFAVTRKRAFEKWRFKPAMRDGIPIEAWREVAVSFVLAENG